MTSVSTYPSIIVLVQHSDEIARSELQFIIHGRFECELNAVDVWCGRSGLRTSSSEDRSSNCCDNLGLVG